MNAVGRAPLHLAAGSAGNAREATQELVNAHAANVNLKAIDNGETPLHVAAACGNVSVMEFLLEKGASITIKDSFGNTPLSSLQNYLAKTAKPKVSSFPFIIYFAFSFLIYFVIFKIKKKEWTCRERDGCTA